MQLFKKLGLMLLMLVMVAQAQQRALELFRAAKKGDKAAFAQLKALGNKGDADAQNSLGFMYDNGEGVPKDAVQAVVWFRKSAEQGDALAQFNLGGMYNYGKGVPKDAVQAVFWYRKSAEKGNASAQSNLGASYYKGEGVPKDLVVSYMWRNLAAAQGNEIAKRAREALGKIMTSAQIAEAQRLSYEWEPKP